MSGPDRSKGFSKGTALSSPSFRIPSFFWLLLKGLILFSILSASGHPVGPSNAPSQVASDTHEVERSLELAERYAEKDLEKSIAFGQEALDKARSIGDKSKEARALKKLASQYEELGDHPRALDHYLQALRILEEQEKDHKTAFALLSIGQLHESQERDSLARDAYERSLELLKEGKDPDASSLAIAATTLAEFHKKAGRSDSALAYYNRALRFSERIESPYRTHPITMTLLGISTLYKSEEAYSQAMAYNRKARKLALEENDSILLALTYKNRGAIRKNMGDHRRSNEHYEEALSFFEDLGRASESIEVLSELAENHLSLEELSQAERYARKARRRIEERGGYEQVKRVLPFLVRILEKAGEHDEALQVQKDYQAIRDRLLTEEKAERISKLQTLYETEKKEKEIMLLRKDAEKQRILLFIIGGSASALLVIGLLLYRQQRTKLLKDQAEQQLEQDRLQNELTIKHQELTTYTLRFVQKNQLLEELKEKVRSARDPVDKGSAPVLNELEKSLQDNFRLDQEWKEFQHYFEQVHPRFFSTLKTRYPDLSNKELRLCALLKLDLSSKEMASLLGISPNSVKMARHRLRKKLGLTGNEDLVSFMVRVEDLASDDR